MRLSFDKNPTDVPVPEDSDPKEVYAFFGLCAFHAQVLEQGLINLVVGLKTRGLTQITEVDIIKAFDRMELMFLEKSMMLYPQLSRIVII
jgi:hypothetical protein